MNSAKANTLFRGAAGRIGKYNQFCLHYNLVADEVYDRLRASRAPFSADYESYLIAALISFDMGRMMGKKLTQRYCAAENGNGFAARLRRKLIAIRPYVEPIIVASVVEVDLDEHRANIVEAYIVLAAGGKDGLHDGDQSFHVGATKLLHFLNPELFPIIDRNTSKSLRQSFEIRYGNSTQPGYSADRYVDSMEAIKDSILKYGPEQFQSLEPDTPLMRIVDKIMFEPDAFT